MTQRRSPKKETSLSLIESPEDLSGTLERVVFHNPDNGYTVLRLMQMNKK